MKKKLGNLTKDGHHAAKGGRLLLQALHQALVALELGRHLAQRHFVHLRRFKQTNQTSINFQSPFGVIRRRLEQHETVKKLSEN